MIPSADKITVAPVGRIAPPVATEAVGDARQQEFQRALAGLVGKSMQAEVLSKLSDGSFLVKVAGTSARMMLPSNPQPGAELPLTLVSVNPRPTFQLSSAPQSAAIPAFVDIHPSAALPGAAAEPIVYSAAPAAAGMPKAPPTGAAAEPMVYSAAPAAAGMPKAPATGAAAEPIVYSAAPAAAGMPKAPATGTVAEPMVYSAAPAAAGMPKAPAAGATAAMQRAASLFGEAPPAHQLSDGDAASTRSTLSPTARVITSVLLVAARAEHQQTAIVAPLPLLPAASADPARLAAVLKDAIGESGLFYESHVAEWSAGKRPLGDLQREPQMQRMPAPAAARAEAALASPMPALAMASPALPGPSLAAADPATAQFINLQLSSQEQGRVTWQGQLWPGQDLAWEISRDPPERGAHQDSGAEPPEPPWRSALRLRFPLLGEIGATVVLAGDQVHIQLQAGSSEIGNLLRARAGELQGALEASGSTLASLTVGLPAAHGNG